MNKKNNEFKPMPCVVIFRCGLCGTERRIRSTGASFMWCDNNYYEVGVHTFEGHKCEDGRIGVYELVGLEPIKN